MGDLPLRTPSHRRFGGPLPRQLPNGTRANPGSMNLSTYQHAMTCVMGYYTSFPMTIPRSRVCCSRVTHPFAGRRQVLLPTLPLDLHVLSLPLAFILSQDQTLHCIFFSLSLIRHSILIKKESTLVYCLKLLLQSLGTCLYFPFSLFNDLSPFLHPLGV